MNSYCIISAISNTECIYNPLLTYRNFSFAIIIAWMQILLPLVPPDVIG